MKAFLAARSLGLLTALAMVLFAMPGCPGSKSPDQDTERPPAKENDDSTSSGSWQEVLTGIAGRIIAAEHGVLFYAFDTLAYPEKAVDIAARLQSGKNLNGLDGAKLGFYQGEKLVGTAETDDDGYGRISWIPPKAGSYEFTVRILEPPKDDDYEDAVNVTPAPLLVGARDKNAELVVVDLDHTVVDSSFFRVLVGGAKPMARSVDVMNKLADRYTIVYLTHRPDILTRKSKTWLIDNGYPRGPLLVSELRDAFGNSGTFKTAKLEAMRKSFPNVRIGIGDKLSDAQAYVDNGLTAYLIPHYKNKPEDMREMADAIRELDGRGRLHVVSGWSQIEAGVFRGKKFLPDAFTKRLESDAERLQAAEERRKESREEDDDD
ncbi:MAG: LNS2 domain-containing protein [Planctomycetota bacterium]|jgi:hypothetical protein